MRGLVAFGFHLIGETVFLLKSLYQLGFVRFFGFYFWIGVLEYKQPKAKAKAKAKAKDYGVVQIRNFNKEMVKLG
ncbi:hypothetical protein BTURTLESOX_2229 [bacterium endosymbiont of Bathymodiolus sp. 5 South]|nr:hypothetical protein BTURTLESOX_2229 [bacterium endosymbiont of Bathymodiolus sp. 5 South]